MRALVFHGPWDMAVEDRPEPEPGPADTLLEIIATGICGSDLHGYTGESGRRNPRPGHGPRDRRRVRQDRTGVHRPGALVTVNPVLGCGRCPACVAGTPQRCPDRRVIGVQPDLRSAFAERMVVPTRNVVPLPDGTPPDVGCLIEPLAVGYHAVRRGRHVPELAPLIEARVGLAEAPDTFRALAEGTLRASKVLVYPSAPQEHTP